MTASSALATSMEQLVVSMSREVTNTDVAVVGIGTPVALAALLLARELHAPGVTIMMPGALNPVTRDVAHYLVDPLAATARARTRLTRMEILDAIAARDVTLQFIRPAQVDGDFRINTEVLSTPSGDLYLVGPVALPEVTHLIERVVVYLPKHDASILVNRVDWVTAPRAQDPDGVKRVVTPLAILERRDGACHVVGITSRADREQLRAMTGFTVNDEAAVLLTEPTKSELDVLRSIVDPSGFCGLEDPDAGPDATRRLVAQWRAWIPPLR